MSNELTVQSHPLITPDHLRRTAVVYIRQSSEEQVRDHTGSTEYQRSLVEIARTFGWARIEMIDEDLGRSGSTTEGRTGWQRLQALIDADEVGAVLVANISRLSRQVHDFEVFRIRAAIHNTLLYFDGRFINPADSNDAFVSQVIAMMAQFENRQRTENMARARIAKAKRGEVVSRLPVGWTKGADGKYDYDPETKDTIRLVIDTFRQTRSLGRTVTVLAKAGVQLPARHGHRLGLKQPTLDRVRFILINPAYTGTYIYGLSTVRPGDPVLGNGKSTKIKLPEERWIKFYNHHPAYITVEEQEEFKSILKKNHFKRRDRAGRGRALCQGLLRCHACGMTLKTQYPGKTFEFVCTRPRVSPAEKPCTCFCSLELDRFVLREVLKVLKAPPLEMLKSALEASRTKKQARRDWIESERERLAHQERVAEERAELAHGKLQRVYFAALEKIEQIREEKEQFEKKVALEPTPSHDQSEEIEELCRVASDVPELWNHPAVTHQEQKEILRCLIDHIVVGATKEKIEGTIFWKAGAETPFLIWRGAGVLNLIRELHAQKLTTREIQQHLAAGKTSTGQMVRLSMNKLYEKLNVMGLKSTYVSANYFSLGQKACDLRREGLSPAAIAQQFNKEGIASTSGQPWTQAMVIGLLRTVGRKDHSLNVLHRGLISEARMRGLTYKEIAIEFNKKNIPGFGIRPWTARSVWRRWAVVKALGEEQPPQKSSETGQSEPIDLKRSA